MSLSKVFTPSTIGPGRVSTITFTITNGGGSPVAADDSCTLRVSLSVPAAAAASIYTNTTSDLTDTIDGFAAPGETQR